MINCQLLGPQSQNNIQFLNTRREMLADALFEFDLVFVAQVDVKR